MNIDKIKKEFPIFDEKIHNNDLVYLDSANSSQKPRIVLDKNSIFYLMSRGIKRNDAEKLLINGFILDAVEKITDLEIKKFIKEIMGIIE